MPDNELVNILTLNEQLSDLWALCYTIIFRIYFNTKGNLYCYLAFSTPFKNDMPFQKKKIVQSHSMDLCTENHVLYLKTIKLKFKSKCHIVLYMIYGKCCILTTGIESYKKHFRYKMVIQGLAFLPASISYAIGTNIFGPLGHRMGR